MRRLLPWEWLDRLTGPDSRKRKQAVGRVCQLASEDDVYRGVLRDALAHPNDHVVFWIVTHLGSLGPDARVAVPELIRLLDRHPRFGTREAILGALAAIAPDAAEAKAAIFGAFADPDPSVRRSALQEVIKVTNLSPEDLARIKGMEADPDEHVARWSEIALRNIRLRGQQTA